MRPAFISAMLAAFLAGAAGAQVALDCPGAASAAGRGCEVYHYHTQMYRPDTRTFVEVWGVNQFASLPACERAREAQVRRNAAVVDFFQHVRNDDQYQPDRIGSCHCDMSVDKTNPRFLTDAQRIAQLRSGEDVRQRVRERLMDARQATDSELVRSVAPPPMTTSPLLSGSKMVPIPPPPPRDRDPAGAPSDLKSTRAVDSGRPALATLDLPLVEIGAAVPALTAESAPPPTSTAVAVAPPTAAATPAAAPSIVPATPAATAPAPSAPATQAMPGSALTSGDAPAEAAAAGDTSAEDSADAFVSYETQRIQNVLKASAAISDESTKARIFEACMQRIQLLSNLRTLIQGSGAKSRLAMEAKAAGAEGERLSLIGRLFGDSMKQHWAPADARDVILEPRSDVDGDAERALRDTSGHYDQEQKKRALYVLLARSQPTEEQQLWLSTVVESFLQ